MQRAKQRPKSCNKEKRYLWIPYRLREVQRSVANAKFQECNNEFIKSRGEQCEKRTNARYWIGSDAVYRHILQLRRPRHTSTYQKWPYIIGLIR